jgi:hypothetical protein
MKVTVKENKTFKPITIELVIESEQELINLYCNLNVSVKNMKEHNRHYGDISQSMDLFDFVKNLMIKHNLYETVRNN